MNVTVTDVLGSLFNPTDTVCFRVFDDKKGGVFQGSKLSCECGKYKSIEETLKNHNAMNRGIFFVVNYGGQDDDSITRINAQFVEMDNDSFDEQQKKINAFPLPPSMIMKTQKSYHVYWFMDSTAKVERFRMIQTQLVKHFDGDPMCVNESRVMRLPGFMHCKKDTPVEVTCVSFPSRTQIHAGSAFGRVAGGRPCSRGAQVRYGKRHRPGIPFVLVHAALPR
jgi:putative DNA primase/helicase